MRVCEQLMPTGIKFIIGLNLLFACLFVGNLIYMHQAGQGAPFLLFVNLVSASALILISLIVVFRLVRLIGFARVLAYALILVLGLHFLLMLKYLMSGLAVSLLVDFIVIFYAIGMRGYLGSPAAAKYFVSESH